MKILKIIFVLSLVLFSSNSFAQSISGQVSLSGFPTKSVIKEATVVGRPFSKL